MRTPFVPPRASVLALLLGATLAPVLAAPDSFDIVGLRLGMTEQQARDALTVHDPQLRINTKTVSYAYSDGVKQHQTAPALAEIVAAAMQGTESITLLFSQPPKPARLVGVRRVASLPKADHATTLFSAICSSSRRASSWPMRALAVRAGPANAPSVRWRW